MPKIDGVWYDEQELQTKLIKLCGGKKRTEQLQRLWTTLARNESRFRGQSENQGYSKRAVDLFLVC